MALLTCALPDLKNFFLSTQTAQTNGLVWSSKRDNNTFFKSYSTSLSTDRRLRLALIKPRTGCRYSKNSLPVP